MLWICYILVMLQLLSMFETAIKEKVTNTLQKKCIYKLYFWDLDGQKNLVNIIKETHFQTSKKHFKLSRLYRYYCTSSFVIE